ncbi:MAG: cellulase family glycosylhydrolase [Lachnospiraceae bacterium]|nr:cellulase family glycosylhydrolase [Lachnospiraceae bacterium]
MRNNKLLIGIIAALTIVIVGLVGFILLGGKDDSDNKSVGEDKTTSEASADDNTGEADKKDTDSTSEAGSSEADSTENVNQADNNTSKDKGDCYVTVTSNNNWESNGKISGQLDISITNNSTSQIKNWTIEIPVADGLKVDSFWNSNCVVEGGVLKITPVEYNGTVEKSSTLKDVGVIVTVANKNEFDALMNESKLLVDGKEYVASASSQDDNSTDNKENSGNNTDATDNGSDKEDTTTEAVAAQTPAKPESGTPFENHGKLSVKGTDIVDKDGTMYQLKGVSTHGIAWFPDYVNKDCFQTFRDDWGANLIRLAMYTHENGGYCTDGDKEYLKGLIDNGVNYATELGMYVIVDWHILHDLNPQVNKEEAKKFFQEMSAKYKGYDNVIYEICNEPNGGTSWADVKSYAEEIIPIIRENAPDAIIIVGTPNWSQDVDIAAQDPITGYDNIMYAAHFYAATHTDSIRNKVQTALDSGLPVFISEFSICDASGNGAIDYGQADKWFDLINTNNLSYAGWNISNKNETSSLIKPDCTKTSWWEEGELSETGVWLRKTILGIQ